MEFKSEKEFLEAYNPNDFERLSMTADLLILSVSSVDTDNYRKTDKKHMSILLAKRDNYPFKDKWSLPGGFMNPKKETLEDCAKRVLKDETNLDDIYLEQLYTFDSLKRDPRMRVVSTAFIALVDKNRLKSELKENTSWFDIVEYKEWNNNVKIVLDNGNDKVTLKLKKELKEKTTTRFNYQSIEKDSLAFDHDIVILTGLERIRNKISYTDIVFNMMPNYFTLGELQQVYEVILNKKLLDPAFRRMISNKVEKTERMKTGEGHRPSYLFRYKK